MDADDDALLENHDVIEPLNNRKSIESIREWFFWSYLNVLIGALIFGLIAIGCSLRTNKFKKRNNYSKAKKWSYTTLFINILATLSGPTLIVYYSFFNSFV